MNRLTTRTLIVITAAICMVIIAGMLIVLCMTQPAPGPVPVVSGEQTDAKDPPETPGSDTGDETGTPSTDESETGNETQAVTDPPVTSAPETQAPETVPPETQPPETVPVSSPDFPDAVPYSEARDKNWFSDALMIGDSRTVGVSLYKKSDIPVTCYAQQSLNISTALTSKFINIDDPDNLCTILQAIEKKPDFKKVYFWFGLNDVGGASTVAFINSYKKLIGDTKKLMPDAEIYVISVTCVSKNFAESSKWGVNNENIRKYNEAIYRMCTENGYHFVYSDEPFIGQDGTLPPEYSTDGAHFNPDAVATLFDYLLTHTAR